MVAFPERSNAACWSHADRTRAAHRACRHPCRPGDRARPSLGDRERARSMSIPRPSGWPGCSRTPRGCPSRSASSMASCVPRAWRRRHPISTAWLRSCPSSFPGTCAAPCRSVAPSRPCCRRRSCRSRGACCARWSGTSSSTRAPTSSGPRSRRSARTARSSTSTCWAKRCSASRRRCAGSTASTSSSVAPTSTTSRSRCRRSPATSRCGPSTTWSTRSSSD